CSIRCLPCGGCMWYGRALKPANGWMVLPTLAYGRRLMASGRRWKCTCLTLLAHFMASTWKSCSAMACGTKGNSTLLTNSANRLPGISTTPGPGWRTTPPRRKPDSTDQPKSTHTHMSDYKHTLNLTKTAFPVRHNLANREPHMLQPWKELDVYGNLRKQRAGREKFILHDGPQYANGSIHLGHAVNTTLKD